MRLKVGAVVQDGFIIQPFILNTNGAIQCKGPAFEYTLHNHKAY